MSPSVTGTRLNLFLAAGLVCSALGVPAQAASYYVQANAGGAGNGTSWANAWTDVTKISWSTLTSGDTVWIAGGSYGSLTLGKSGTADSDTGRIFIKRATAAAHGTDTGWSSGFDSQVVLSSMVWKTLGIGSYVTIDGQVDSGIRITQTGGSGTSAVTFDRGANYVTLRYLELQGPGDADGYHHAGDDRGLDITAWNGTSYDAVDYLKVQYTKIHGACTQVWNMNSNNSIWEYNQIYNSTDSNGNPCHPNVFVTSSSSNVTFRYNKIYHYSAEGIMMLNGDNGAYYVYGNLWYDGQTYARVIETQKGTNGPVYFYNNTISDLWAGMNVANAGFWASGSMGRNNIWWNTNGAGLPSEDFNFCSGSCGGANSISSGTNPFTNYAARDFSLASTAGAKTPINKGTNLGPPYSIDMRGVTRGADGIWDIGAFELGGVKETLNPPTNLTAITR